MLDGISEGIVKMPYLILVYGESGAGKTTFAADFPKPIFLGPESGSNNLNVGRFKNIKNYSDLIKDVDQLLNKEHDYKTAVFDSLDWIEPLLYDMLKKKFSVDEIEDTFGGYGKWVNGMLSEWRSSFLSRVLKLREEKGMNIIFIAHYQVKAFHDPLSKEPYDKYSIKLQEKTAALFREFVDGVFFINSETFVKKDKGMSKAKAFTDGSRYIYTTKAAAFDAKNRFNLPDRLDFPHKGSFRNFEEVLSQCDAPIEADLLLQEIQHLLIDLPNNDPVLIDKIKENIDKARGDFAMLTKIKARINEIITEGK